MSSELSHPRESRVISDELNLPFELFERVVKEMEQELSQFPDAISSRPEAVAFRQMWSLGPHALAELFFISRPEVVLTRRPRMIPLCVPSPHFRIERGAQVSTAGMFCRDDSGDLGVTGCYHGTGPVGTAVVIDGQSCSVKLASPVQDLVFITSGETFIASKMVGLGGVLADREPARADRVYFDGATNQQRQTRVFSADAGLLRARPTIMLKVQTDPDTDQGDSGSALLDEHDRVLGFAFERTGYEDYPQFTDWIWAANALRSLALTPYKAGD
jgi:hypothetical protein